MSADAADAPSSSSGNGSGDQSSLPRPRRFEFPSHQSHMLGLAKMCKESKQFADCVIQSDAGFSLKAHKLVLGAASNFLKNVFQQVRDFNWSRCPLSFRLSVRMH